MLLSIDGTLLVQILNFVVFWVLLNYVFIAPTRKAIEERQRIIATQHREADDLRKQAAALQAQAAAIIDDARRRTAETMREAAARASVEVAEIERRAYEEAAATIARAQATVASELAQATAKQTPFVAELANSMVKRALDLEGAA
jgi:F-type H+-transporting ATPase subunit b